MKKIAAIPLSILIGTAIVALGLLLVHGAVEVFTWCTYNAETVTHIITVLFVTSVIAVASFLVFKVLTWRGK